MKKWLSKLKNTLDAEAVNLELGIGRGISRNYHSCGKSMVTINGIKVVVQGGVVNISTDNNPYIVVLDGERGNVIWKSY